MDITIPNLVDFTRAFTSREALTFITLIGTLVYFSDDPTIGIKQMQKLAELMKENHLTKCIFVYPRTLTFSAKRFLSLERSLKIEMFCDTELIINVTRHVLAPCYRLVSTSERKKLSTKYGGQFPRILVSDPVAKYYGMRCNDVVEVSRYSETAGDYVLYRICV